MLQGMNKNVRSSLSIAACVALMSVHVGAQISRDACIRPALVVPADLDSAVTVAWTASGSPLQTVRSTQPLDNGLTVSDTLDTLNGSSMQWSLDLDATTHAVHELRQVVHIDTLRLLTTTYIAVDRRRSARGFPQRTAIVVVDHVTARDLEPELAQYRYDLLCEGWFVRRIEVPATIQPRDLKQRILETLHALPDACDRSQVHVTLVGDLPYASSGGYNVAGAIPNPDFHPEHGGAWASDAYYADIETSPGVDAEYQWTDDVVTLTDSAVVQREENRNVPGDGKFDQSVLPSDLELCVGRINMTDLPTMGSPLPLLRRYFTKNHEYRTRTFVAPHRALIDDNFGLFTRRTSAAQITEAFAASAWRSFSVIVGPSNIIDGDWIGDPARPRPSLASTATLLAYGCGGGGYEHCSGVVTTAELSTSPVHSVFTLLFGSYFGDVASTNNLMRAALAAEGWTLTCGWSGRPHWFLHPLAAGATIGECQRLTANNNGEYVGASAEVFSDSSQVAFPLGLRNIHTLLLGDPTLRLQGPVLAGEAQLLPQSQGVQQIEWESSAQHSDTTPTAYIVEASPHVDSVFSVIDVVPPSTTRWIRTTVTIPSTTTVLRVRPYFTSAGRLAPLPGRGILKQIQPSFVEQSRDVRTMMSCRWVAADLHGRIILAEEGPHIEPAEWVQLHYRRLSHVRGMIVVSNGNSAAVLRISP